MEIVFEILKDVAALLIVALIDVPLFRLSARILVLRRLSFGATYLLALIASGSMIVAHLVALPLLPAIPFVARIIVTIGLSLAVSGWVVGYFVTSEDRKSIGFAKGAMLAFLVNLLFAVVIVLPAVIVGGLFGVKP